MNLSSVPLLVPSDSVWNTYPLLLEKSYISFNILPHPMLASLYLPLLVPSCPERTVASQWSPSWITC